MTAAAISLEAAGTELHIDIHSHIFLIAVTEGVVECRDVIDVGYDACLSVRDLGALYRAVESLGIQLDGPADTGRF